MPKSKPKAFLYSAAWKELNRLAGTEYRLIVSAIDELERNPRPPNSKRLEIEDETMEIRRYRTDHWRIIYAVQENSPLILAIRRRPPYDYEDLENVKWNYFLRRSAKCCRFK